MYVMFHRVSGWKMSYMLMETYCTEPVALFSNYVQTHNISLLLFLHNFITCFCSKTRAM